MISKTLKINKSMCYGDIFNKIYLPEKINSHKVAELHIDDNCISYDILSNDNEVSISLILEGETNIIPTIKEIVISIERGDLNLFNDLKLIWLR